MRPPYPPAKSSPQHKARRSDLRHEGPRPCQLCRDAQSAGRGHRDQERREGSPRSAALIALAECSRAAEDIRCFRKLVSCSARAARRTSSRLDRRTLVRTVGAEHAAVARHGAQHRLAVLALVEPLAGVGRHRFLLRMAALRTGEDRLKNDRSHVTEPASPTTGNPRRPSPASAPRARSSRDRTRRPRAWS